MLFKDRMFVWTNWLRHGSCLDVCEVAVSFLAHYLSKNKNSLAETTVRLLWLNRPVPVSSSVFLKIAAMHRLFFSFSGEWRVFSGNELGALLGWWLFTSWKEKNQDPSALKDTYMLSSTVSSKILRAIALKEGFHFEVRCWRHVLFSLSFAL